MYSRNMSNDINLDYLYTIIDKSRLKRDYYVNPLLFSKNGRGLTEFIVKEDIEYLYNFLTKEEISIVCNCSLRRVSESLKRYGIIFDKDKNTLKQKRRSMYLYGVIHPAALQENILRVKNTKKIKYGDENYNNSNKAKDTCKHLYGKENAFQVDEFKTKAKNTIKNKYGNSIYQLTDDYKEKSVKTSREHYGVDNPAKADTVKQKVKNTWISKYGVKHPMMLGKTKDKLFETLRKTNCAFESKIEKQMNSFLIELGFKPVKYKIGSGETRVEIDSYISEKAFGIEMNGVWWHSKNNKRPENQHFLKSKWANANGIRLVHVWEDQWQSKKDLIKTIIKSRLGVLDKSNKIYARNCKIKEIDVNTYRDFCNKNHIQGYKQASIKLGLFYNDELVQIASFSKTHNIGKAKSQNSKYEYEWVRGCPASNNIVIGGTSKLFKHFVRKYNPQSVLCYADWNLFDGKGYKECGFNFVGYTGPDKFYVIANSKPLVRINRNPYRYSEFKELVKKNKLLECYGAGSLKFEWKSSTNL